MRPTARSNSVRACGGTSTGLGAAAVPGACAGGAAFFLRPKPKSERPFSSFSSTAGAGGFAGPSSGVAVGGADVGVCDNVPPELLVDDVVVVVEAGSSAFLDRG